MVVNGARLNDRNGFGFGDITKSMNAGLTRNLWKLLLRRLLKWYEDILILIIMSRYFFSRIICKKKFCWRLRSLQCIGLEEKQGF